MTRNFQILAAAATVAFLAFSATRLRDGLAPGRAARRRFEQPRHAQRTAGQIACPPVAMFVST